MSFSLYLKYLRTLRPYSFILVLVLANLLTLSLEILYNVNWALTLSKYTHVASVWLSVMMFPYRRISLSQYKILDQWLIMILLLLCCFSIIRVPFNENLYEMDEIYGNWLLSWIMSPVSMLAFYPIVFMLLNDKRKYLVVFKHVFVITAIPNALYSFVWNYGESFILYCLPFFKHSLSRYKVMYRAMWFVLLMKGLDVWGVMRIHTIFMVIVVAVFAVFYWKKNILRQRLLALLLVVLPLYFVADALVNGNSVFQSMGQYSSNEVLTTDTRTFLYEECIDDLVANNAVLLGKGCHSFYHSDFFYKITGFGGRNAVEVPILNFWLKSGFLFCIIMLILMLRSIYLCLFDSKNSFSRCIGLLLAGLFLILFVGDINGVGFLQILMWFFIGCGLSKSFRHISEKDMNELLS